MRIALVVVGVAALVLGAQVEGILLGAFLLCIVALVAHVIEERRNGRTP